MSSNTSLDIRTEKPSKKPILRRLMGFALLVAVDSFVIWLSIRFFSLGYYPLVAVFLVITIFTNVVILRKQAYPLRWMIIGLVLMTLFTIYPIFFTVWVSFTNYGESHLITKKQAIDQIEGYKYLPEAGKAYTWTAFKSPEDEYALWLIDAEGTGYLATTGAILSDPKPGEAGIGELDDKGIPKTIEGFQRLNAILAATDKNLKEILFGEVGRTIQVRSPSEAAELLPLYVYDITQDAMINQQTGVVYTNLRGIFTSSSGEQLRPGFVAPIGFTNFKNFFINPALRGPMVELVTWNFAFAILSLLLNFSLGLAIAIMFNDPHFPYKKLIRSLLIIPYTVPALITILIWRGMLNPELGVISHGLEGLIRMVTSLVHQSVVG